MAKDNMFPTVGGIFQETSCGNMMGGAEKLSWRATRGPNEDNHSVAARYQGLCGFFASAAFRLCASGGGAGQEEHRTVKRSNATTTYVNVSVAFSWWREGFVLWFSETLHTWRHAVSVTSGPFSSFFSSKKPDMYSLTFGQNSNTVRRVLVEVIDKLRRETRNR